MENQVVGNTSSICDSGEFPSVYIQVFGTVWFVVVWPFIVLDMKWFPLGRPAAALVGALLMVVTHVVTQDDVYEIQGQRGNLQTVFLLVGMMMLSYYYDREGVLQYVGLWVFGKVKRPFRNVLWRVSFMSAFLSAIVTNDATCLVITPLLLKEFKKQSRDKKEILPLCLGIATAANIGSAATVFGNPQNAFIAASRSAEVTLLQFLMSLLPAALVGVAVNTIFLYLLFWRSIMCKRSHSTSEDTDIQVKYKSTGVTKVENEHPDVDQGEVSFHSSTSQNSSDNSDKQTSSGNAQEQCELSAHLSTQVGDSVGSDSDIENERNGIEDFEHLDTVSVASQRSSFVHSYSQHDHNKDKSSSIARERKDLCESISVRAKEQTNKNNNETQCLKGSKVRKILFLIWLGFITLLVVILLAIPPPPTVNAKFNLGLVPLDGAIFTMLVDTIINRTYAYDVLQKIDWTVILMFMGLFVWLEGFQNTCYVARAFEFFAPHMNLYRIEGVLLFAVFVIIGSNLFSNVPLTILIVDRLGDLCGVEPCEGPLGALLLAWISTIAGNFTLIGSVANLIVAEKARSTIDYNLTFWNYIKFGAVSTFVILFGCLPIVYFVGRVA